MGERLIHAFAYVSIGRLIGIVLGAFWDKYKYPLRRAYRHVVSDE